MEIKITSYSKQSSLLSSILFFILGAILFTTADKILNIVSIIIGSGIAAAGAISLIVYYFKCRKGQAFFNKGYLIFGIIAFILAIVFIFFSDIVEQAIRFIIGGWILLTGIMRLISALSLDTKTPKFLQLLLVSFLLIGIGIYTIVVELWGLDIIGIIMMLYAIVEIIGYVLYSKGGKPETKESKDDTLIIPETTEKSVVINNKKENIKDAKEVKPKKKLFKKNKKKDNEES